MRCKRSADPNDNDLTPKNKQTNTQKTSNINEKKMTTAAAAAALAIIDGGVLTP